MSNMVKVNKRYWWMSDTSAIVYDWQFSYAEWIDITSLEYVTPNPNITRESADMAATYIFNVWLDCSEWTASDEIYFFWENGKIIYKDVTSVYTMTNSENIINAVLYNRNVLWFTKPSNKLTVSKISIDNVVSTWRWSVTETRKEWNTTDYIVNEIAILLWNNVLLVWYGRSLWRLNASDTREELIDDMVDDIIWLTSANTFIRIYLRNWQVLTYDGASSNVDYTTNLEIGRTTETFGVRGTDYVVSATEQLLVSNWLDYQKLKSSKNYVGIDWTYTKYKFNWNMVEYRGNIYWITWDSITSRGIIENWLPTAFNKEITKFDDWVDIYDIKALCKSRDWKTLYFIASENDTYKHRVVCSYKKDKDTTAWSLAQIYSPKFMFGRIKRLGFELYIRADADSSNYIEIYYKINWWTWVLWSTINEDIDTFILNNSLTYNELELWFKFIGSPKLYEYEFNQLPEQREWQT